MIDTIFALVPTYGAYLIAACVTLSCLALPLPSSLLVLAAGGFAASGDLNLWEVGLGAFAGFALGDQLVYLIGRRGGTAIKQRIEKAPKRAALVCKAEKFVEKRGAWAVLASRTIVSPLGPYVGFVGAAAGMTWLRFSVPALSGAAIWSASYAGLGYSFADRITEIASIISNLAGVLIAIGIVIWSGMWLIKSAKARHALQQDAAA